MEAVKVALVFGAGFVLAGAVLGSKKPPAVASAAQAAQIVQVPQATPPVPQAPPEVPKSAPEPLVYRYQRVPDVQVRPAHELRLINFNCTTQYGYATTQGLVKNISNEPINSLVAIAEIYAENGTFIKSDMGVVDYQPLMPGQTSPFKVMTPYNPMGSKCSVGFKRIFGGAVAFTDK